MRRWILPVGAVLLALWIGGLWATGGLAAVGTQPVGSIRIQDGFHTQLLRVDHNGAAAVTCMTAAGVAESCGGTSSGGDTVNVFHQSTIRHISSTTHVSGGLFLTNQAGTPITATGTALDVNCTGCAAASVVAVTHISSALHIAGTAPGMRLHVEGVGSPGQSHGGVLTIQGVTGGVPVAISGTITAGDAVNVFHQSTVRHISSVTHVAGYGSFHIEGRGIPGQAHGGVLTIQGITGMVPLSVALTSGGDAVNVFHQSTVRHISSVTHVNVIGWSFSAHVQQGAAGQQQWPVAAHLVGVPSVSQGTAWAVTAHQGGQWNVGHVSSRLHVVLIPSSNANDVIAVHTSLAPSTTFPVQQGFAGQQAWPVTAHQGGQWNVAHISARVHAVLIPSSNANDIIAMHIIGPMNRGLGAVVAHGGGLQTVISNAAGTLVTVTGTALDVNCTGCAAASVVGVTHISSALHIAGTINGAAFHVQGLGVPGQAHGGVLTIQGVTGGIPVAISGTITAGDAVNVFHQSTVRHVSSVTHVAGYGAFHISGLGVPGQAHGGVLTVQGITGGVPLPVSLASGGDAVNVFHQSTVRHVSSVTHVAGYGSFHIEGRGIPGQAHGGVLTVQGITGGIPMPVSLSSGGDAVNVFHQSTVRHISSVTHVAGYGAFHISGLGVPGQAHGGVLTVQGITGGVPLPVSLSSGGDAVNVFHQSTVRHISSEVHALIRIPQGYALHVGAFQGGSWTIQATHQGGEWNIRHVGSYLHVVVVDWQRWAHLQVSQSGSWTVQAAHQGGEWNVRHISGSVHIGGTIAGAQFHIQGLGVPGQAHGGVLTIQGITGGVPVAISGSITAGDAVNVFHQSTIRHISGEVHALIRVPQGYALHVGAFQGGSWTIQAAHQGGEWNVRHISSRTHVLIEQSDRNRIGVHQTDALCLTCSARISHAGAQMIEGQGTAGSATGGVLSIQGAASMTPVRVDQNSAPWTIGHVSAQVHIAVALKPGSGHQMVEMTGPHLTGAIHVSSISNVGSGAPGTGTTAMACHSTLAIHVAATAPGYTQIIHLTSTNGGIDQTSWRVYICSIMVVSAHAQGFSLLEGTGTTCLGQVRHAVIGSWRPEDSVVLAAGGGFSVVSPFPVLSTQVRGNNLCIGQTTRASGGTISGFMSYRAGP